MASELDEDDRLSAVEARASEGWPVLGLESDLVEHAEKADLVLAEFDERCRRLMHLNERIAAVDDVLVRRAPPPAPLPREDLERVGQAENAWKAWSEEHRPHGPFAEQGEARWIESDRLDELHELVRRFDRLDPSMAVEVHAVQRLLADPERRVELRAGLERAETEQGRQRKLLQAAAERLRHDGLPVPTLDHLPLLEGYAQLDQWTQRSDHVHRLRLRIDRDIRPFDPTLADKFAQRLLEAANADDPAPLTETEEDVDRTVAALQRRLDALNSTLDEWRAEGFLLPIADRARPEELLDWEANMAEVERLKVRHANAWRRLLDMADTVGERAGPALALAGDLQATEAFIDRVDELHAAWGQAAAQAQNILEAWDIEGMDTARWHELVEQDPASALRAIEERMPLVHRAVDLRRRLDSLDLSVEGEELRAPMDEQLRAHGFDAADLDNIEAWIGRMERRVARHLAMVLDEWSELRRAGWTDLSTPPASNTVRSAEVALADLRRRTKGRKNPGASSGRILARLEEEIQGWAEVGWDVERLLKRAREDPLSVGLAISGIRAAVAGHRRLARRLEVLPWERDPALGEEVVARMRRPEELEALATDIPRLARQLATSPPNPAAPTWRSWRPASSPPSIPPADPKEEAPPPVPAPVPEPPVHQEPAVEDLLHHAPEKEEAITMAPSFQEEDQHAEVEDDEDHDALLDEADTRPPDSGSSPTSTPRPKPNAASGGEDLRPLVLKLLSVLGLDAPDPLDAGSVRRLLAPHVAMAPRDFRLSRWLRLVLRLLPEDLAAGTEVQRALLDQLASMVKELEHWTVLRLRGRHLPNDVGLLKDAEVLGQALARIPGPGRTLPLVEDDVDLPGPAEVEALSVEVDRLERAILLPSAGGVR